ncbi:PP2C family protein-serine/threonine phosphatase [Streptomyces sp. RerS4]|uniref:PP2C family protein-serine/threonine phosphatase n=1 Tax=Streptomyces sp. RerS4 TaxID=2942449 RepID=UPI00201BF548|nr:PP2C family protein-serine/threonine phosphatase [Streptomyces sp. RerS4]UQX02158.1 serine/threonine-protein phosphatase [Streptomyces sp. RerS4]
MTDLDDADFGRLTRTLLSDAPYRRPGRSSVPDPRGSALTWLPDRLLTAVFADLDLVSGIFTWVNCGHPAPLIIRHRHVVPGGMRRPAQLPLGLRPHHDPRMPSVIHRAQLEPGDRILIRTDGVTEARSIAGELFGEERLIDTVVRATAAGEAAPKPCAA